MEHDKYESYLGDLMPIIKDLAKKAKLEADHPQEGEDSFNKGFLMGYHVVIQLMKDQTQVFNINQEDIGLADIEPKRDLILNKRIN